MPGHIVRALLVCYAALVVYPVRYHFAATGLDPSWAVALNYLEDKAYAHGRDIAFTYGPLGYLILPMPFGSNLGRGIVFQLAGWLLFAGVLAWLAFSRKFSLVRLAIFAACMLAGNDLFHEFGYAGPDFFLGFLALLLLAASVTAEQWPIPYCSAIVLAVLLVFVKLSTGMSAISAVFLLAAATFLFDRRRASRMLLLAALVVPLLFVAGYLIYVPSVDSLVRYVRAAMDISSSYNSTMSQAGDPRALAIALGMLAVYALLCLALLWDRQRSFLFAFAAAGPLFLEFKHSFVREAGHTEIVFTFLPLLVGLIVLFTTAAGRRKWAVVAAVFLLAGVWCWRESGRVSWTHLAYSRGGLKNAATLADLANYSQLKRTLEDASRTNLAEDRLPPDLLAHVAGHSVGIFPWEVSYAAANPIVYRPFPVFQTYSASTPFLDRWNAEFLEDPARSPEFLLVEWKGIDNRHPFLDVPYTSIAMFREYEFDSLHGARLLLRRRSKPLDPSSRLVRSDSLRFGQPLMVPESTHPLYAQAFLKLSLIGRLRKFFFRLPEVDIVMSSAGTRVVVARVPPDVMEDGIPVNFLPSDLAGTRALFEQRRVEEPLRDLVLSGPGAAYFENPFRVELYELNAIDLTLETAPAPNFEALRYEGALDTARIESLNGLGVIAIGEKEVVELNGGSGMLVAQGWAFDQLDRAPAAGVFVSLDGKLYPTTYGNPRLDIAALFRSNQCTDTGFQWAIPAWKLGKSVHEIALKVLSADGKGYYDGGKKHKFRIGE